MRYGVGVAVLIVGALARGGVPDPAAGVLRSVVAGCTRIQKAGTQVSGDVKICPGRFRIPDPTGRGVIVATAPGTRIDLTGVTLMSGDSVPSEYRGIGITSTGVDSVAVRGGVIGGFHFGIRLDGGTGHRISGVDVSGSRTQTLRSTPDRYDEGDWLDIFHPDSFEAYGHGIYLKGTTGASVTGVIARGAQNGIGLSESRDAIIADNDVSGNSGWGIDLYRSSRNAILRNRAHHSVRCESPAYRRGCDSAALLLRDHSDSNLVVDNDLSWSGDGFFLSGQRGEVQPSIGNLVIRNNASFAYHNAFESTFSEWNTFLENRADSSDYGFWLGYSRSNTVQDNSIVGSRTAGIAIEHGGESEISGNVIIGGQVGIRLFTSHPGDEPSADYRVADNTIAKVAQGVVLEHTTRGRLRGNLFDGVDDGIVADSASGGLEVTGNVFLSARRWFIDAPVLDAGGNFWAAPDAETVGRKLRGRITVQPFRKAQEAGY
jgi:parallel beta-helix repeat protein